MTVLILRDYTNKRLLSAKTVKLHDHVGTILEPLISVFDNLYCILHASVTKHILEPFQSHLRVRFCHLRAAKSVQLRDHLGTVLEPMILVLENLYCILHTSVTTRFLKPFESHLQARFCHLGAIFCHLGTI